MFHLREMGIVIEKESDVVCVYGTDNTNSKIFCAVPLCHPKYLKGEEYQIAFFENDTAVVSVSDFKVYIDYSARICSNNKNLPGYGSDDWGHDISKPWDISYDSKYL